MTSVAVQESTGGCSMTDPVAAAVANVELEGCPVSHRARAAMEAVVTGEVSADDAVASLLTRNKYREIQFSELAVGQNIHYSFSGAGYIGSVKGVVTSRSEGVYYREIRIGDYGTDFDAEDGDQLFLLVGETTEPSSTVEEEDVGSENRDDSAPDR